MDNLKTHDLAPLARAFWPGGPLTLGALCDTVTKKWSQLKLLPQSGRNKHRALSGMVVVLTLLGFATPAHAYCLFSCFIQQSRTAMQLYEGSIYLRGDVDGDKVSDAGMVKLLNTGSGNVEVHIVDGKNLSQWLRHQATPIPAAEGLNDFDLVSWSLHDYDGNGKADLVGVKTRNSPTGFVELHVYAGPDFRSLTRVVTKVPVSEAQYYRMWQVRGSELIGFRTSNTGTDYARVDRVYLGNGAIRSSSQLAITETDARNFVTWFMDEDGSVAGVKLYNCGSGKIELHVMDRSNLKIVSASRVTPVSVNDTMGWWVFDRVNKDYFMDLTMFKDLGTGTGMVEVHVVGG